MISRETILRLGFAGLIANGDAPGRLLMSLAYVLSRMIRNAIHAVAFSQRDIEQARCPLVFKNSSNHPVEITKACRQGCCLAAADTAHRSEHSAIVRLQSVRANYEFVILSAEISCLLESVRVQLARL